MKFYNLFDSILQPKYHHFSQKHSWLYHNITQDNSSAMQYAHPNNFPNPVKITDLRDVQAWFIFICLLFKDTGFSLFELLYEKKLWLTQILVNLILQPRIVMLQSLLIPNDILYIILYCHCNALFPFKSFLIWIKNYLFLLLESIPPKLLADIPVSSPEQNLLLSDECQIIFQQLLLGWTPGSAYRPLPSFIQVRYPHPSFFPQCWASKCHRNRLSGSLISA